MKTVNLFTGKKGETGQAGLDGVDINDIRSTLIENPLIDLFRDNKISKTGNPNWTRTATASIVDRYGQLQFVGGDTIENKFSYSEDFSQWADTNSQWTILSTGLPDPIGGNDATRIRIDANPSSSNFMTLPYVSLDSGLHVFSVWIRVISGSVTDLTVEPVAPGVEISVPSTVVSEWQRVSLRYSVSPKNDTYAFNIKATQNTEVEIFGIQLEFNTQVGPYAKTTGTPVDGPNPETRWRANDVGYLIEGQKENLTTFSEDFNESAWDVGGGAISAYSGASPAGEFFKDLQVNFTSNNVTLSQDTVSITDGETYTVSLWVLVETGSIDSVVAQVGNGITQAVDAELSGEWQRVSVECVAGSVNTFSVTLTTSESGTIAAVFGAQLEVGSLSSYVRTFDSTAVRTADLVEIVYPYNFPDTSLPWSCIFSSAQNTGDDGSRYVFHNGLSGGGEFSAYYTPTSLFIVVAGVAYEYSTTKSDIEIIYDGTNLSVYSLSVLIESKAVTASSNALGVTMHLGQDLNNQNHLNSLLKGLTFWDDALTFDELRYIRGSDYEV